VVQNPETIKAALPLMVEMYEFLLGAMGSPIKRYFIRKSAGGKVFRTMQQHLIPLLTKRLPSLKDGSEDTLTRRAPAMILFLCDRNGEDIQEDIHIAATYGMLAAHAMGLGGSIMHIIPPAIERKKELRALFNVSDNQEVVSSLILGYPKHKYQRGITRTIENVKWI
jgi:nitroreductase